MTKSVGRMQHYALILAYSRVPLLFEYMLTGMYLSSIYVHKISFTLTSGDLVCQGKVALGNLSFTIRELQNSHHDTPWWVWGLEHFLNEHYPCGLVQHGMPCRIHVGVLFQYMTIFEDKKVDRYLHFAFRTCEVKWAGNVTIHVWWARFTPSSDFFQRLRMSLSARECHEVVFLDASHDFESAGSSSLFLPPLPGINKLKRSLGNKQVHKIT